MEGPKNFNEVELMFWTLLYYVYVYLDDAEKLVDQHLKFCKELGIKGRVLIADEGLNGTVSGTPQQCKAYMKFIESDKRFEGIEWKIDEVDVVSFAKMHVRYRPEIVNSGLRAKGVDPLEETGVHLSPTEFKAMKNQEDVIVLDVRSNYEHNVGRFQGALTLDIDNFREFPNQLDQLEAYKGKKILTYCTGGVKCEKASAFLLKKGFEEVYQLHGGIINYGKIEGGEDFEGNCYVFDNRVQIPVNTVNPSIISTCHNCGVKSVRIINCANPHCNNHLVQCEACGIELKGNCTIQCSMSPATRPYNNKGYYTKNSE